MNGGRLVAEALARHGVQHVFTLCGGHISPILVESKRLGLQVVDTRDEANALFAADAVARLTGIPGVAAVTAGPGVTNTITALKNAQLAQSPVVLLGGSTATVLRGRGALQDIDQMALVGPHVKWAAQAKRVRDLPGLLDRAFAIAREGVPGPVFVECPVDLLYDEELVKSWYGAKSGGGRKPSFGERALQAYLDWHTRRLFAGVSTAARPEPEIPAAPAPDPSDARATAKQIAKAERPLLLVGSQAMLEPSTVPDLVRAIEHLGIPVYLTGMARGLLGSGHELQCRHQRRKALKAADLVVLAGVPCDFRLDYGRHVRRGARLVSANRSREDLLKNRRPSRAVLADPSLFVRLVADAADAGRDRWTSWREELAEREAEREAKIVATSEQPTEGVNPLDLFRRLEPTLPDDSVLVADGGDFVGTASYILSPRRPLSWLDPGVFGTLGVGAGFAIGAQLCRPEAEVWIIYGDGSAGYTLAEFDTYVRHGLPIIALVGNDACWMQIAREQVEILEDDVGCALRRTDYHVAAEGMGGRGIVLDDPDQIEAVFETARAWSREGHPVLINAHIGPTDFRKGSISI